MSVTVVLPTGRPPAALRRWLKHARSVAFPFPVVIGLSPAERSEFSGDSTLPGGGAGPSVRIVDVSARTFLDDAIDCLAAVTTRYAVLLDPRDFTTANGLAKLARFLDAHKTYLCAGGLSLCYRGLDPEAMDDADGPAFALTAGEFSPESLWMEALEREAAGELWWAMFGPLDLDAATPEQRIARYGRNYRPLYSFLYRVGELRQILSRLAGSGLNTAFLTELMVGWESVVRGRFYLLPTAISAVVPGARFTHYRDYRIAYSHFFCPAAMDAFHRAAVELSTGLGVAEARRRKGLRALVLRSIDRLRHRLRNSPADSIRAAAASAVAGSAELEPQRYNPTERENAIRSSVGLFVNALTRNEIAVMPGPREAAFGFLREQLRGFGLGDAEVTDLLIDVTAIREAIVAA